MTACVAIATIVAGASIAFAANFMDVSASDTGQEYAVRKVWTDGGLRWIGVMGDKEFTLTITESSPLSIDTCWIYIDGTTTTGTTRNCIVDDLRVHYACAVIKYVNGPYELLQFRVQPAWNSPSAVTAGATAPTTYVLPVNGSAAAMILPVAEADPDGPVGDRPMYCTCENEGCYDMFSPGPANCDDRGVDCHHCWDDDDCTDVW